MADMPRKLRVGILFGGKSAEHEISLLSAKNVINAIDKDKYDLFLLGIDREGRWRPVASPRSFIQAEDNHPIKIHWGNESLALVPGRPGGNLVRMPALETMDPLDVIFPVLHGPYGEDGTVQGLLKLAGTPFVGSSVLGSAIAMDKDVMKRLLRDAGIPIADFQTIHFHEREEWDYGRVRARFEVPFFIKPANLGSSVGVHKVRDPAQFDAAVGDAFQYDNKILIEEYVKGREIECAVLGNENPAASVPGEILPSHEFYSYEAKYTDEKGALLRIPADLSEETALKVRELSVLAFKVACCEGMARVDCFLKDNGTVIINELNTIPGFTSISMYPRLWEASGIPYSNLIDRLIQLALDRFSREQGLSTAYRPGEEEP